MEEETSRAKCLNCGSIVTFNRWKQCEAQKPRMDYGLYHGKPLFEYDKDTLCFIVQRESFRHEIEERTLREQRDNALELLTKRKKFLGIF